MFSGGIEMEHESGMVQRQLLKLEYFGKSIVCDFIAALLPLKLTYFALFLVNFILNLKFFLVFVFLGREINT